MGVVAPELSENDIRLELERIYAKERRSQLAALFGSGPAGTLQFQGEAWEVVPTRCEFELRAKLPPPGEAEGHRVYLIDWTEQPLPLDISCRFAAGRIFQISRDTRLASLFGARQAEPGLMATALARVLLSSGSSLKLKKVATPRLTREEAYRRFLDARLDVPLEGPLDAQRVVLWGLRSDAGPAFVRATDGNERFAGLRKELTDFVREQGGPLAGLAWVAWELGQVRRLLTLGLLVDAHLRRGDVYAAGLLEGQASLLAPGFGPALLSTAKGAAVGDLVRGVLAELTDSERRALLQESDELVPQEGFRATRESSPWLPSAHRALETALAVALEETVRERDLGAAARAIAALTAVEAHGFDRHARASTAERESRRTAVRLATWLAERAQRPAPPMFAPAWQAGTDLAVRYAEEGGFVDWARGRLRAPTAFGTALDSAVRLVLEAADVTRHQDDERFAKGLVAWWEAKRPATQVTPIERATAQLVGEFLDHTERPMLVVLMDGMSQASMVQLLTRLQTQKRWAPIVWRPKNFRGARMLPPVLAALPTLTQVSRASFFAGRFEPKFGDQNTSADPARWANNPVVKKRALGAELPPLIMRGGMQAAGDLPKDVKDAIHSEMAVVGVVVNAIDEQLKGSAQVRVDYSEAQIPLLDALLTEAEGAERVVLLASDHGHVLGHNMRIEKPAKFSDLTGGARWRALGPDDPIRANEVKLPDDAWRPAGSVGVAALWDETVANRDPKYGEHGGVSLAEVVAPAVLIAPEWLHQVAGDHSVSLETRPLLTPDWWELRLPTPRLAAAQPVQAPASQAAAPSLPFAPPVAPVVPAAPVLPAAPVRPPVIEALTRSKLFKEHVKGQPDLEVSRVVDWLTALADGPGLPAPEFARRCQIRPHQVAAVVARMGILNSDGFAVVEYDPAGRQVVFHKARLVQQFGLEA